MERDVIEIAGGKYRVRFNWNALTGFLSDTGQDDIRALTNFKVTPGNITTLIFHGIREGERLDGKEFPLTKEDIGAHLNVSVIERAMEIFVRHNGTGDGKAVEDTKTKKKGIRSLLRSGKSTE